MNSRNITIKFMLFRFFLCICCLSAGSSFTRRIDCSFDVLREFCSESSFLAALCVTVVGTLEGVKAATKVKMDLKKPITQLACHPRHPILVFLSLGFGYLN